MRINPNTIPEKAPPKNPPQDLPSPNILFPLHERPKSIFVLDILPKTTAAEFGIIAGKNSQRPVNMIVINPTASIVQTPITLMLYRRYKAVVRKPPPRDS